MEHHPLSLPHPNLLTGHAMRNFYFLLSLLLAVACVDPASQQASEAPNSDPSTTPMNATYLIKRSPAPIQIDGTGADPAWQQAQKLDDFRFPWLEQVAPLTQFWALYDDQALYFLFDVVDEDVVLVQETNEKAEILKCDRVELFFAQDDELKKYYCLEIDAAARPYDYYAEFYRKNTVEWQWPGLRVMAHMTEAGYKVEGAIPMASLKEFQLIRQGDAGEFLRAGAYRAEFSHEADGSIRHNWISWITPDAEQPDFHIPSSFGTFLLEE